MKTITLRGINDALDKALKEKSRKQQESVNQIAIKLLNRGVGLSSDKVFQKYDDLDSLAGTWSEEDEMIFHQNTQFFNKIDGEMWE